MKDVEISKGAFIKCKDSDIECADIPEGVHSIGGKRVNNLFPCSQSLKSVKIPKSVKRIYTGFCGYKTLSTLEFEGTMAQWKEVKIYDKLWRSCTKIKSVKCSDGEILLEPYEIKDGVLLKCYFAFDEFSVEEGVKEIADEAFDHCSSIEKLTIGESVKKIGKCSFAFCHNLKQIVSKSSEYPCENGLLFCDKTKRLLATVCGKMTIPAFIKSLDSFALQNCTEVAFEKGGKITSASNLDYGATKYDVIIAAIDEAEKNNAKIDKSNAVGFTGSDALLSAIVEESGVSAETYQDKSAVILAVKIGDYGLEIRLSSKNNSWQNAVRSFLKRVNDCKDIVQLIKAAEDNKLRIAGNQAKKYAVFKEDVKEKNMYFNNELESVYIADGVTKIGKSAFYMCEALKAVFIPKSVLEIANSAFTLCSSLKAIEFGGTFADFNAINKNSGSWNWGCNTVLVKCTDKTVNISWQ